MTIRRLARAGTLERTVDAERTAVQRRAAQVRDGLLDLGLVGQGEDDDLGAGAEEQLCELHGAVTLPGAGAPDEPVLLRDRLIGRQREIVGKLQRFVHWTALTASASAAPRHAPCRPSHSFD